MLAELIIDINEEKYRGASTLRALHTPAKPGIAGDVCPSIGQLTTLFPQSKEIIL